MASENGPRDIQQTTGLLADIVRYLKLVWSLMLDQEVPLWLKILPPVALLYVVSPLDLLPDVVPGLGQLDDLAVLLISFKLFVDLAPTDIVQRLRSGMSVEAPPDSEGEVVDASYRVLDDE